jgi:hypothetical protein
VAPAIEGRSANRAAPTVIVTRLTEFVREARVFIAGLHLVVFSTNERMVIDNRGGVCGEAYTHRVAEDTMA